MSKVEILVGAGWYADKVGDEIEVEDGFAMFRKEDGGKRVQHYIAKERIVHGDMVGIRYIQRSHAKEVKDSLSAAK